MIDYSHPSVSRQEALALILQRSQFQPRVEVIATAEALGRITAQETWALNTLPNCPTSMLDGIALKSENLRDRGIPNTDDWQLGVDYVFSNTGVGIPEGFDTVVLIEDVTFDEDGKLRICSIPEPGKYVRPVGEMMKKGELLIPAQMRLKPVHLALLTAGGVDEISVLAKPKVAILPTGNELVPAGCKPPRGMNVESNGTMIKAQIQGMGAESRLYPITRDNPAELTRVINEALLWADIIILNGGTSKGSDDRSIEVLEAIGEVLVYQVDYGPGRHTMMAIAGTKPIIGTVGPTIGAEYAVYWYVEPLINKYLSQPTAQPMHQKVRLLDDVSAPMDFDFYARMEVKEIDGDYVAAPIGRFAPLAQQLQAKAVLRVPKEIKVYKAGESVEVELR